jgi:hypothetical protein
METLAAVGLAAAVVQFVEFSSSLISAANEVYSSQSGMIHEQANLEYVYGNLQEFSSRLAREEVAGDGQWRRSNPAMRLLPKWQA